MDTTVTIGIAGIIATIISPIVVQFYKEYRANKHLPQIQKSRLQSLCGTWSGSCIQDKDSMNDPNLVIDLTMKLNHKKKRLYGDAIGRFHSNNSNFKIWLTNGTYDGKYLNILFSNMDTNTLHRGMLLLEINNQGTHLAGKYLANGLQTGKIVSGKISLKKV